jgi:hypothetical protein
MINFMYKSDRIVKGSSVLCQGVRYRKVLVVDSFSYVALCTV